MKRRLLLAVLPVIALVVLAGAGDATSAAPGAGEIRGVPWTGPPGVTVGVSTLQARQRKKDKRRAGKPVVIREKPEPGEGAPKKPKAREELEGETEREGGTEGEADRGDVKTFKLAALAALDQRTGSDAVGPRSSVAAGTSFLGAQSGVDSPWIPPDSMGSVGPTQALVAVNGRFRVFDKQGSVGTLNVDDATFWSDVRDGQEVSDPEVEYDRLSGRWIISAINLANTNNRVMVAVSSGSTITDKTSFTFFQFSHNAPPPAGDGGLFADYPQMGVDKNAVYIGVNDFGSTFAHTTAFVIRKSSLLSGGPPMVTAFRNLTNGSSGQGPFSPQPAQNMDPNVGEGYIVGVDNALFSRLDVRRISDPGGTPSMSGNLVVSVPTTSLPPSSGVPAQGTHNGLDALDDRLFEAMIGRAPDGSLSLWTAHNIRVDSSGSGIGSGDRVGGRWYQLGTLSTTPSLVQSGTMFDPSAVSPRWYWIPSIAANGQGNASLNSSAAGPGYFAEIAASAHLASDTPGETQTPSIVQASSSTYNLGSGNLKRWGDYSQTVVDPTDNQTFWTFQEYASAKDTWGLRVIKINAPPPATPSTASPNTVATGLSSVNVQISGTSAVGSGAAFFDPGSDPGGPGYPSHISADVSGGVTVNGVTYTDPTHVTLNLNTTGVSTQGPKDVTITNPDGQSVTGSNILVVGSDTTPPEPPTFNGTNPASPSNVNTPKVLGLAEGGSTVDLYTNSSCSGPPAASGSAAVFASPGIPVTVADNSTATFYGTATDLADNTSPCSTSSVTYVEDSIPPASPSALTVSPTSPANDNNPMVSGSANSGTAVNLYKAATTSDCTIGNLAATGSDTNFASPGLTASVADNSSTVFRATATDAAGNISPCSTSSVTYVEDSIPPASPSALTVSPTSPANDNNPMVSGSANSGTAVKLYKAATTSDCTIGNLAATGSDTNFASPGLTASVADNSSTVFRATATDAAGNISPCSTSSVTYVEDSMKPDAPTNLSSSPTSPANDTNPKILGTAENGATVRLYTDATCTAPEVATGTAAAFASPGIPVTVDDNTSTDFRATATDAAGNTSGCSLPFTYVEDSTLPATPTITGISPASPANNNFPKVFGSAPSDTTVRLYDDGNCTAPTGTFVPIGPNTLFGSPGIIFPVGNNTISTIQATATDSSSKTSGCSIPITYVEDSTFPQAAIDSGPSGATGDATPSFTFHASDAFPPGDTISFLCSIDSGAASFRGCSGPGRSETPSPLSPGAYAFRVRASDAAGNASVAARSFMVQSPTPSAAAPPETMIKGPKKTRKRRPKFKFFASEPGVTFLCKLDKKNKKKKKKAKFKRCKSPYRPPKKLKPGKHRLAVKAVDAAGNVDPTPAVRKFKILPR